MKYIYICFAALYIVAAVSAQDFGYHLNDGTEGAATKPKVSGFGYQQYLDSKTKDQLKQGDQANAPAASYARDGGAYDSWLKAQKQKEQAKSMRFAEIANEAMSQQQATDDGEDKPAAAEKKAPKAPKAAETGGAATGAETGGATGEVDPVAQAEEHVATAAKHKAVAATKVADHQEKIKDAFIKMHASAKDAHEVGSEADGVVGHMQATSDAAAEAKRLRAELGAKTKALEQATNAHKQALRILALLRKQKEAQGNWTECEAKAKAHHEECKNLVKEGKKCPPLPPCGQKKEVAEGVNATIKEAPETPEPKLSPRKKILKDLGERMLKMALPLGERRTVSQLEQKYLLAKTQREQMQGKVDKLEQELEEIRNRTNPENSESGASGASGAEGEDEGPSGKMLAYVRSEINGLATTMGKLQTKVITLANKKVKGFNKLKREKKKKEDEDDTPKPPAAAGNDPNAASSGPAGEGAAKDAKEADKQSPSGLQFKPVTVADVHNPGPLAATKSGQVVPAVVDQDPSKHENEFQKKLKKDCGCKGQAQADKEKKEADKPCDCQGADAPQSDGGSDAEQQDGGHQGDGPYTLGKKVYPHEPIDPTSPGKRSVADQVYEALGGDKVMRAAAAGDDSIMKGQDPKKLSTTVGFGESDDGASGAAAAEKADQLEKSKEQVKEEDAREMRFKETPAFNVNVAKTKKEEEGEEPVDPADHSGLETSEAETGGEEEEKPVTHTDHKGAKHKFHNMGPLEEQVARHELQAATLHNRAEEARLKWMEARKLLEALQRQEEEAEEQESHAATAVDEKVKAEKTNEATEVNDLGKLNAAKKALAMKPKDETLKAIVKRLGAAIEARKMVGKRDAEDKHEEQKEEQKKLSELYGRKDQVKKQDTKVKQLKASFEELNKLSQQAAQDSAEIRARYKIKHTIDDLAEKQDELTGAKIDKKAAAAAKKEKKDDSPSAVQKELMKVGTTFSDAVAHRVGGAAGIPTPMKAPQLVSKEQMGAAVGAAVGAQRGAQVGAMKGSGEAALVMSRAGESLLEVQSKVGNFADDMANKALEVARNEQEAAHRAFEGMPSDNARLSSQSRAALEDAEADAESVPATSLIDSTMKVNANQENLLQTSMSSAQAANAAMKRAQLLRSHANRMWSRTPTAQASPNTIRRNDNAQVLFQNLPPVNKVADPLFMETASWLKSQKLPEGIQVPQMQQQQIPQLQQPSGTNSFRGMAQPIVNSQTTQVLTSVEGLKESMHSLNAPLPDLNE